MSTFSQKTLLTLALSSFTVTSAQAVQGLFYYSDDPAARIFENNVLNNANDPSAFYTAVSPLNEAQTQDAIDSLHPDTNRATNAASRAAVGIASRAISARGKSVGANSGEAMAPAGIWLEALYGTAEQDKRGGVAGFDLDAAGFILGADTQFNDSTVVGVAFSHLRSDIDSQAANSAEASQNLLSLYALWEQAAWSVNGNLTYGVAQNDAKRFVMIETNKASFDSSVLAAELFAGYSVAVNNLVSLKPTVGTRYMRVESDSYREKGGVTALAVGSQSVEVLELGAGLELAASFDNLKPYARVMAYHDFAQDEANVSSAFIVSGPSFVSNGMPATPWTYEAGVGLDWTRGQYTLGAAYQYTGKAGFDADTFSLKARYDF